MTSDARDLDALANSGDQKAKLALKMMTYGIIKYIGSYAAVMNGVDLIIFTGPLLIGFPFITSPGGIGEHTSRLRRRVCENFSYLGLKFDYEANSAWGEDAIISLPDSKVKVALITTDEEIVIARDTMHIVQSEEEN
ncbi:acetate kinase [Bacteroides sp. CAG:770]|nr:acetate kinase [Bacteroides sp. CAG:770]